MDGGRVDCNEEDDDDYFQGWMGLGFVCIHV